MALNEAETKRKYYGDLNNRVSDAIKSYEKLLQDRLNYQNQSYSSNYASNQYYNQQRYPSTPAFSDHGYSVPPTPAQPAYGDFYQHRVSELSFQPPQMHYSAPPMSSQLPPQAGFYPPSQHQQAYPPPTSFEYPSQVPFQEYSSSSSYGQPMAPPLAPPTHHQQQPPPTQQAQQQQPPPDDAPLIEL